jgi:phosphoribosylglycinamide formyltransferase-1
MTTSAPNALRERISKICLGLPEAEASSRTGQHAKFTVRGRTLAYFLNDHHGDGRVALSCKMAPGGAEVLIDADPDRFFRPAYSSNDWIAMRLDLPSTDWPLAEELVRDSYRMVAPKRLAAAMDGASAGRRR